VEDATSGVFSADGRLFFASSGDLWEGTIEAQADVGGRLGVLIGARIAPLAFLNTDEANGGGMWLSEVRPGGKWLYCTLRGHHMGALVRTPLPPKALYNKDGGGFPTLKASYAAQIQSLSKTEVISEDLEDIYGFCVTETDGKPTVFFYARSGEDGKGPALMLWNGAGKPKVIGHLPKA